MTPSQPGKVGEAAQILGIAGLLPQVAAAAITGMDSGMGLGAMFAFGYACLILSFIGGMWWGFAMHHGAAQARIALFAVLPSIAAAAVILCSIAHLCTIGWGLVLLGVLVLLTLPIDRWLVGRGLAPEGWMHLRIPLSLGLGALTILTGALA